MAKVWDERQKRWVWDGNKTVTPNKTTTSTNTNKGTTTTGSNKGTATTGSNKTYYRDVTWKPTTKSVADTGEWDTSYVQASPYYREWTNWDKKSDISNDPNRSWQMKYNIWQDAIANPKLFTNRADYNKYYKYDESSDSQKQLLDEAWDNYNKYGLNSTENFYTDQASKVADDKNRWIEQNAADKYSKLMPAVNKIISQMWDRLWPVFDELRKYQNKYLNDMSELRKLQNDYYAGMKREYDALAAGQSASVGTTLSGQGLSQSAIASTIDWVDKNWQSRYNSLMWEHINTLKWLQDSEQNFMNSYGNLMWSLSSIENQAVQTWYNSFKTLEDELEKTKNNTLNERYNPYQVATNAKVAWAAETSTSAGKLDNKQAQYQWADNIKKRGIIYNQLYGLLASTDINAFNKLEPYIAEAVAQNPNDWQAAISAICAKAWAKAGAANAIIKAISNTPDTKEWGDEEETKSPKWEFNEDF